MAATTGIDITQQGCFAAVSACRRGGPIHRQRRFWKSCGGALGIIDDKPLISKPD
jgi:hypothetical protein